MQDKLNGRSQTLLLILTILGALFLSLFKIDKSVWLDEANSILTAILPPKELVQSLIRENNAPGYYFLLHYWIKIFGYEPVAVRSLSVLFYLLTAFLVYKIAMRLFNDQRSAIFSVIFFVISPVAVSQSQNIRMYALLGFMAALSTYLYLLFFHFNTKSKWHLNFWILINAAGLFVHYWYFFVIVAQGIGFLIFFSKNIGIFYRYVLYNFLCSIPFVLLWLPAMLSQLDNGSNSWMKAPSLLAIPNSFAIFMGGSLVGYAILCIVVLLLLFDIAGKMPALKSISEIKSSFISKEQKILYTLCVASVLVPWLVSQWQPVFVERYTIIALPVFALALGRLLSLSSMKSLAYLFSIALLFTVSIALAKHRSRPIERSDKLAVEEFLKISDAGDVIIFTSLSRPATEYYLLLNDADTNYTKFSFPAELALHPSWRDVEEMMGRKDELQKEAQLLVNSITESGSSDKKVWVFYGRDRVVDSLLKEELDRNLHFKEAHPLGTEEINYLEILEYHFAAE